MNESDTLELLYAATFLLIFIVVILNLIFNVNLIILGGVSFIFLGIINLYLKDRIWYLFWTLVPAKSVYVKLLGSFLILIGLLFTLLGLLGLTIT